MDGFLIKIKASDVSSIERKIESFGIWVESSEAFTNGDIHYWAYGTDEEIKSLLNEFPKVEIEM